MRRTGGTGKGGGFGQGTSSPMNSNKPKRNSSILNFFKKSDGPVGCPRTQSQITEFGNSSPRSNSQSGGGTNGVSRPVRDDGGSLFVEDVSKRRTQFNGPPPPRERGRSETPDDFWGEERYNENEGYGVKKRKVSHGGGETAEGHISTTSEQNSLSNRKASQKAQKKHGPFIDESDSEDELEIIRRDDLPTRGNIDSTKDVTHATTKDISPTANKENSATILDADRLKEKDSAPTESKKGSIAENNGGERLLLDPGNNSRGELDATKNEILENEVGVEAIQVPADDVDAYDFGRFDMDSCANIPDEETPVCPVCQATLENITDMEISLHVNNCLDGNPTPEIAQTETLVDVEYSESTIRSETAKPGQKDPIQLGSSVTTSAFSKIMSGNAEDTTWAAAAAREVSSKGRRAADRTCPFYKILPGLYICVDAFRYGAVEGCNAYFLSHFHSDHYVGLTSTWCHGMIYCSKVTGNLVRQELKVDPKWVVDLEFEKKVEVPNTEGVHVTMIPANHCPGSSLFLYEKEIGNGSDPRMHRVLHCGDFRACPSHARHPLLRPDVLDIATGQKRQQKIDACYLDTTYLNPKYAFPSQEDVITACAEMCVSLSKDRADHLDVWEKAKRERAGSAMSNFVSKKEAASAEVPDQRPSRGRLLVVLGTYSIGKERICVGIAKALRCKIYASPAKQRICSCLEDPELSSLLTSDPLDAQVHMQSLMELRPETLAEYLNSFKPHFTRIVAFRPTGWNYRPPAGRMIDNPPVSTVLHSDNWKTRFRLEDLVPQRGSNKESSCFGVPYSEHSSFRELTMFCCALRIARVIPTVNVGSAKSRERMKTWIDKWEAERRKNGLFTVDDNLEVW